MEKAVKAQLILENGAVFNGQAAGHMRETMGEVVFNTSMAGYQEVLTDPSYHGQIVVMTYPLIGNYGINLDDMESMKPRLSGFAVREMCDYPNNWRCEMELAGFLKQHKIMGIQGIDTRALTRVLRDHGTMKGILTTRVDNLTQSQVAQKFQSYTNRSAVSEVTIQEAYTLEGKGPRLAVLDFGIKNNILRNLHSQGFHLTVFPAFAGVEEILSSQPDGIFLSNGPGDPEDLPEVLNNIKTLIGKKPIFGICLGHQLLAMAMGCSVKRLKFGHHGGNHPVKHIETGRLYVTSQNHEFVVDSLSADVEVTFRNVNDGSIEGIQHKQLPVFGVQFHPEAAPGPLDTGFLFESFLNAIGREVGTHA